MVAYEVSACSINIKVVLHLSFSRDKLKTYHAVHQLPSEVLEDGKLSHRKVFIHKGALQKKPVAWVLDLFLYHPMLTTLSDLVSFVLIIIVGANQLILCLICYKKENVLRSKSPHLAPVTL